MTINYQWILLATPKGVTVDNLQLLMNVPDFKFSPHLATALPSGPTKTRTTSERVPADLTTRRRNCHPTGARPSRRFASAWTWEARQGSLWSKSMQARCTPSLLMGVTETHHLDETPGKASSGDPRCRGIVGKKGSMLSAEQVTILEFALASLEIKKMIAIHLILTSVSVPATIVHDTLVEIMRIKFFILTTVRKILSLGVTFSYNEHSQRSVTRSSLLEISFAMVLVWLPWFW